MLVKGAVSSLRCIPCSYDPNPTSTGQPLSILFPRYETGYCLICPLLLRTIEYVLAQSNIRRARQIEGSIRSIYGFSVARGQCCTHLVWRRQMLVETHLLVLIVLLSYQHLHYCRGSDVSNTKRRVVNEVAKLNSPLIPNKPKHSPGAIPRLRLSTATLPSS